MMASRSLAVMLAVNGMRKPRPIWPRLLICPLVLSFSQWLGCRDSNPNFLIQSQASYR